MFICMIIIFGFEYAGLVNREKNLEFRQSFVKGISVNNVFNKEIQPVPTKIIDLTYDMPFNKIEKENKLNMMFKMLHDAAQNNVSQINQIELPDAVEFFE